MARSFGTAVFASMHHAFTGIAYAWRQGQNIRIQSAIAVLVLFCSFVFQVTRIEFLFLVLFIIIVLVLELVNTAIEFVADLVSPRFHEHIKIIKDVMAGAVLLAAIGAVIVGAVIFSPYLVDARIFS